MIFIKKIITHIILLCLLSGNSFFHYDKKVTWNQADVIDYVPIFDKALSLFQEDNLRESVTLFKEIILKSNDKNLIMNSHYHLGQFYLSRSLDYESAIKQFNYILNSNFSYDLNSSISNLFSIAELKEKSLFMIGYIYNNHIGNLSKAKKYYNLFLTNYHSSDLVFSVEYELDMINQDINKFKAHNK